jgi:hypothetical protein
MSGFVTFKDLKFVDGRAIVHLDNGVEVRVLASRNRGLYYVTAHDRNHNFLAEFSRGGLSTPPPSNDPDEVTVILMRAQML